MRESGISHHSRCSMMATIICSRLQLDPKTFNHHALCTCTSDNRPHVLAQDAHEIYLEGKSPRDVFFPLSTYILGFTSTELSCDLFQDAESGLGLVDPENFGIPSAHCQARSYALPSISEWLEISCGVWELPSHGMLQLPRNGVSWLWREIWKYLICIQKSPRTWTLWTCYCWHNGCVLSIEWDS